MTRPNVHIVNAQTQEEIIREMNDEEYAQYLLDVAESEKQMAERLAKEQELAAVKAAVEAKLVALGLDLDTVKAIAKLG